MKTTQCLYNSRVALHRVFVSPLEASGPSNALRSSLHRAGQHGQPWHRQTSSFPASPGTPFRHGLTTSAALFAVGPRQQRTIPDRLPIDLEIRDRQIMLVEENNQITGPHRTRQILDDLDLSVYSLRTIEAAKPPPSKPEEAGAGQGQGKVKPEKPQREGARFPLCRIVHKADEYKRQQARTKAKKAADSKAVKLKELEVNWAIAQNDLALKLRQMTSFLEKGHKVGVMFARKKGARVATSEEMMAVVKAVKDTAAEVKGTREWKASEGEVGRKLFLYFEGKVLPPPS